MSEKAAGDLALPGVLVSGLAGPRGICEDHLGDLQKHFTLITMKEFLKNKNKFREKIQAIYIWGGSPVISRELLLSLPSLKLIASAGVGLDHLDLPLITGCGVKVANTPRAVSSPTADLGMALLLASARRVVEGHQLAVSPCTEEFCVNWMGQEVSGATLGIVGMGTIGYKIAQRARAFEMKILYHNRNRRKMEEEEAVGATYCKRLDDLLQQSDFVMLVLSLTPQTQGLIGRRELLLMKPSAVLINIGRGLVVDHDALAEALKNEVIKSAALDVTYPEPLPREHPLLKLKNVILTPHIGSATHQARRQMMENMVASILAALSDLPIPNEVVLK
ncbi:glyoxylate/hydroxypyruvate reductase B-like isoform X2 [Dipodomys spectabilis]|uniref:glyoxylate/hydroxypyruvate reductase B-like isoform X2 n=1 Tax=Dipodomys spectabilis TaxID=105255 RepID=UPI001C5462CE|nr:glyoxylate/hydroxypyruvate reductase B-like isoform X2 [Dipodomys spectabilis]